MAVEINLDGKVAVITGGGGGIGAAIAEEYARAGARVVVADISGESIARTVERISGENGMAYGQQVDVTEPASVDSLFDHCIESYGGVDIFVASAGISDKFDIFKLELEEWRRILDINLTGSFLCAKRAVQSMRDHGRGGTHHLDRVTNCLPGRSARPRCLCREQRWLLRFCKDACANSR